MEAIIDEMFLKIMGKNYKNETYPNGCGTINVLEGLIHKCNSPAQRLLLKERLLKLGFGLIDVEETFPGMM
jgi:hypothetical protein